MIRAGAILSVTTLNPNLADTPEITPRPKPTGEYIPERTQKRNLSTDSTPSPTSIVQQGKKYRSDTLFDSDMEPEAQFTLADIMNQLKLTAKITDLDDVVKKKDLVDLQTVVTSHTLELRQIREDLLLQTKRIQELETTLGQVTASNMKRRQPDVYVYRSSQNGGPLSATSVMSSRRKNLVFEGLPLLPDRETIGLIIEMCSILGIVTYQSDFDAVTLLTRRDGSSRPPPILITFTQFHVRSAILRNKSKLVNYPKFATVFVNPDEPIETRRAKAVFRRIGYLAKQDGKSVLIRDEWIRIDDEEYKISDLEKIPEKYRSNLSQPPTVQGIATAQTTYAGSANPLLRSSNVKIKATKAGLTFSGPSAFLSHMYKCPIVYKKTPYSSVEQGYHHLHAEFEEMPDVATRILNEHEPREIKNIASNLPKSDGWNRVAPDFMWDLNEAKYEQNPDL